MCSKSSSRIDSLTMHYKNFEHFIILNTVGVPLILKIFEFWFIFACILFHPITSVHIFEWNWSCTHWPIWIVQIFNFNFEDSFEVLSWYVDLDIPVQKSKMTIHYNIIEKYIILNCWRFIFMIHWFSSCYLYVAFAQ